MEDYPPVSDKLKSGHLDYSGMPNFYIIQIRRIKRCIT